MLLGKGRYGAGLNRVSLSFRNRKEIKVRRRAGAAPQATRGKPSFLILCVIQGASRGLMVLTWFGI